MRRLSSGSARRTLLAAVVSLCGCAQVYDTGLAPNSQSTRDLGVSDGAQASAGASDGAQASADLTVVYDTGNQPDLATPVSGCDVHAVKVNEIRTAGSGGASDEFIELYNPCTVEVAMAGAKVVYRATASTSDVYVFWAFSTGKIPAGGHFLLANTGYAGSADAKPFMTGGMAATAGGVALKDSTDAVIDSVGWGTATNAFVEAHAVSAPASGQSASRSPDGIDTNDNVADFVLGTSTPGAAN